MCAIDHRWVLTVVLCTLTGCATTSAPPGFLPDATEAQSDAYGSWIEVSFRDDVGTDRLQGELIAITADSTWILSREGPRVIATSSVVRGQLTEYDSDTSTIASGAIVGFISTISNGVFLILTGPMWIIGGSAAAASQSRLPNRSLTEESPVALGRFARFPSGMPEGVALGSLEMRPPGE